MIRVGTIAKEKKEIKFGRIQMRKKIIFIMLLLVMTIFGANSITYAACANCNAGDHGGCSNGFVPRYIDTTWHDHVCSCCRQPVSSSNERHTSNGYWYKVNDSQHNTRCSQCGGNYNYENHWVGTPATCTDAIKCGRCSSFYGSALGHDYSATCEYCGVAKVVCSRDASHILEHDCSINKVAILIEDNNTIGEYTSINDAVAAARTSGSTPSIIKIMRDTSIGSVLTIPSNKKISLDLSGHSVTSSTVYTGSVIVNSGYFEITDSSSGQAGSLKLTNGPGPIMTNQSTGTLKINAGTISSSAQGISNSGTMEVNGGTITGSAPPVSSGGTLTMNGGIIKGGGTPAISLSGDLVINGGQVSSNYQFAIGVGSNSNVVIGSASLPLSTTNPEIIGGAYGLKGSFQFNNSITICISYNLKVPSIFW